MPPPQKISHWLSVESNLLNTPPAYLNPQPRRPPTSMPTALIANGENERRRLCASLGRRALEAAPRVHQDPWLHDSGLPPATPTIHSGSLWNLVHNMKVLHQFTEVLSEAASNRGPHALAFHSAPEACVRGLEPFAPLLEPISPVAYQREYEQHVELWRVSNPGLYSHAEAAYHVHQSYSVEDPNMTRLLVWRLTGQPIQMCNNQHKREQEAHDLVSSAHEYDVAIAGNILRARPASYEEFYRDFMGWRRRGLYHTLCLAARMLPRAELWVPENLLHESQDWQELLDEFTRTSFCTNHRLAGICERLADRSPALTNHICGLLDRIAVLFRVKSWDSLDCCSSGPQNIDDLLQNLSFSPGNTNTNNTPPQVTQPFTPTPLTAFTHGLVAWGRLKSTLENTIPPSLLCHPLCPSGAAGRDAWGYPRLDLCIQDDHHLFIQTGPIRWVKSGGKRGVSLGAGPNLDRFQDILQRMGECSTCPEMAHLMLSPETMEKCLAGEASVASREDTSPFITHLTERQWVIDSMSGFNVDASKDAAYRRCIDLLVKCLPSIQAQTFPAPLSILSWRVDCPPRAILYQGGHTDLDLQANPPHTLIKAITQHKVHNKTISGICILSDTADTHTSLRACVAQSVLGKHPEISQDFARHPFNHISITGRGQRQPSRGTMTTLAESVALFTGPLPVRHMEVDLHQSSPWDQDYIDDRYAETQRAENGLRFRDWITMYRSLDDLQRSRLAAHHVFTDQLFHTHFPVISSPSTSNASNDSVGNSGVVLTNSWVSVASTLPAETRVLRQTSGKTHTDALRGSVVGRFMNDLKLLPVWNQGDVVDPSNAEVYTDEDSKQVAIVYAPRSLTGDMRRLEMISFRL